jgi:hypothetical protein
MTTELAQLSQDSEPTAPLLDRLRFLAGRRRALACVRGLLWSSALALAGLLLVGWLDLLVALSPALRVVGAAAALVLTGTVALRGAVLARRLARPAAVARDLDRLAGSGGQVAVGLDLTQPRAGLPPLSLALARIAVHRAAVIAAGIRRKQVEPLNTAGPAFKSFLGSAVGAIALAFLFPHAFGVELARLADPWGDHPPYSRHVFRVEPGDAELVYGDSLELTANVTGAPVEGLDLVVRQPDGEVSAMPMFQERSGSWRSQLTEVTSPLTYWVSAGRARSRRFNVSVVYTPRIEALSVRVTPPAYTNRPAAEGPLPQGGIAGLRGSSVQISVRSNRPLSRAEMKLSSQGGDTRTVVGHPQPEAPKAATCQFQLEEPGRFVLWVVDEKGERSAAEISAPILLLEDKRPFVRIAQPMAQSFATPDVSLPVRVEAEDDYGISSLRLYRSLNGSRHLPEGLIVPIPAEARVQAGDVLALLEYSLSPGDAISLFARVEDTDPAGPNGSESALARITIISRATYEEWARTRETRADFEARYAAAARRLEGLASQAEQLREAAERETGQRVEEEMRKRLASFAEELRRAARETAAAAEREPLYALDADLAEQLRELADALERCAQAADRAAGAPSAAEMREALGSCLDTLGAGRQRYGQRVAAPLERFMQAYSLLEMQERFIALYERQRDLAERMSDLKGRDGEADPALRVRMRDLQEEQGAIKAELSALVEGIRAGAAALPDDPELDTLRRTATRFADEVQASRALPAMDDARQGLSVGSGTTGYERATEAANVLESFISRCQAGAADAAARCRLAFGPTMQESAAKTAAQLLAAAGLNAGRGQGPGIGSGRGGYSIRANTLANVGVYGPATMSPASAGGGRDSGNPAAAWEDTGGAMGKGIGLSSTGAPAYEGIPLQSVPPQHRAHVRDYFRRVAEESSAGAVVESGRARSPREAGQ